MIFKNVKGLTLPNGNAVKLSVVDKTLWQKVTGRIPAEYQEVEWLQSAGTSGPWIDLGFAFDTKGKTEMSQYIVDMTNAYVFGAAEKSGVFRCMASIPYSNQAYFYGSDGTKYLATSRDIVVGVYNEFEALWEKGNFYAINKTNGSELTIKTHIEYTMTSNLYLFGQNYNGTARTGAGTRRIKYFRYYDKNDNLICDLVPCYRKNDGVMGMYDIARSIFLTKAGGGDWTKGADVTA